MSQTNENIAKKSENITEPRINWLQKAFDQTPKGELKTKVDRICEACGCSLESFYRWKRSGRVPNKLMRDEICKILNFDLQTLQTSNF